MKLARDFLLLWNFSCEVSETIRSRESVSTEETKVRGVKKNDFRRQNRIVDDKRENNWQIKFWPKRQKRSINGDAETVAKCNKS